MSHVVPLPSPPGKLEAGGTRGAGEVALGSPFPAASLITVSPQRCSPCHCPVASILELLHPAQVPQTGSGSVQCDSPRGPLTNHGPLNDVRDQAQPVHPAPDGWPGADGGKLSDGAQEIGGEGAQQVGVLSAHPTSTCPQCSEQAFVTFPGLKFPSIKQESWTFFFFFPAVKSFFTHGSPHASASKDTKGEALAGVRATHPLAPAQGWGADRTV